MAEAKATLSSIDAELCSLAQRELALRDARLGKLIEQVGPCELTPRGDPYRELVRSVVFQQLAGSAARSIHARLRGHFGGRIPRPERLAATSHDTLRSLGLSRQKAETVVGVARAFECGELNARRLRSMSDDEVLRAVTKLRGIGDWTAHMLLMFCLGRPDILPVGDFGVRKGASLLYALPNLPKPNELESLAEAWRPFRSIATWYLWRRTEL